MWHRQHLTHVYLYCTILETDMQNFTMKTSLQRTALSPFSESLCEVEVIFFPSPLKVCQQLFQIFSKLLDASRDHSDGQEQKRVSDFCQLRHIMTPPKPRTVRPPWQTSSNAQISALSGSCAASDVRKVSGEIVFKHEWSVWKKKKEKKEKQHLSPPVIIFQMKRTKLSWNHVQLCNRKISRQHAVESNLYILFTPIQACV